MAWRQAIIWSTVDQVLIWHLGTNFGEVRTESLGFLYKKMYFQNIVCKTLHPFSLGINLLTSVIKGVYCKSDPC